MSAPSYSDLVARIEALESGVSLDQLPMADLMRRLEATWQPDSSTLLQPNSVGTDLLSDGEVTKAKLAADALAAFLQLTTPGRRMADGNVNLVWPGASAASGTVTVTHNLKDSAGANLTPSRVVATLRGLDGGVGVFPITGSVGATTFNLQGIGTAALGAVTVRCDWVAIG